MNYLPQFRSQAPVACGLGLVQNLKDVDRPVLTAGSSELNALPGAGVYVGQKIAVPTE